ncbi:hypothetical protein [Adhaeribacter soli]|uniref:Glycosyltransferase RgtA/B/C/D-like domain-containing protein n=1 Tax=Adhaeribacter soli TaxID=2607655 RepID=A0A5N1J181_9BACT|nr:hypothetical protein [Adhaeribacter soli]KAA9340184.1 hypothetical protein F0P94_07500 [Adhaeribacter soli]
MLRGNFQVLKYGLGVTALVSGFLLLAFLLWPYVELQLLFRQFEAEKDWLLPWNSFTGRYGFSKAAYVAVKVDLAIILLSSLLGLYKLHHGTARQFLHSLSPVKPIAFFWQKLKQTWQCLPLPEKWIVGITGLTLLVVRTYFLFTMRIGQDEAATYMLFLTKGPPGIIFYYPLPNNHIFYNLLCLPLHYLFSDPYWVVQLPVYFISIISTVVIYLALRSFLPFAAVYLAVSGFSFSYMALFYSVHGRGYFLVAVCSALAAIALIKILERKEDIYWLVFLVCTIAGFYTVPVFLYPFVAMLLFAIKVFVHENDRYSLGRLALVTFFAGFATILLYLPVLMGSGFKLLFFNDYVSRMPMTAFFQNLPGKMAHMQGAILGQETVGFYLWLLAIAGITFLLVFPHPGEKIIRKAGLHTSELFLVWCGSVLPWVMLVLQRVSPPERVFFFKSFFDFLAIGLAVYLAGFYLLKRRKQFWYGIAGGWLLLFGAYEVTKQVRAERSIAVLDERFDDRLQAIRQTNARKIFATDIYYSGYLRYEYFKHGVPHFIIDEHRFEPTRNYDLLILNRRRDSIPGLNLSAYNLWFQDSIVKIYLRK